MNVKDNEDNPVDFAHIHRKLYQPPCLIDLIKSEFVTGAVTTHLAEGTNGVVGSGS